MNFDIDPIDKLVLAGCLAAYIAVLTIGYVYERPIPCSTDIECQTLNPNIDPY